MEQPKFTWRQYGEQGGRPTNFEAGKSQTAEEIRSGVQPKISNWFASSKNQPVTKISGVTGSHNNINVTMNIGNLHVANVDKDHAKEKDHTGDKSDVIIIDEDLDASAEGGKVTQNKEERPEKRPRSDSTKVETRKDKMLRIENAVAKSLDYAYDTFQKHREALNESIRLEGAKECPDPVVLSALKYQLSGLPTIWKNSCDATWVDEDSENALPDLSAVSADKKSSTEEKRILLQLSKKVPRYTLSERTQVVAFYNQCMASKKKSEKEKSFWLATLRGKQGYEKLSARTVQRWAGPGGLEDKTGNAGRPRNHNFAVAVFSKLVIMEIDKNGDQVVSANVMYQYETIRKAALETVKEDQWKDDTTVNDLKFCNSWVKRFLTAMKVSRLRVTNVEKVRPSVNEVRSIMKRLQQQIDTGPMDGHYNLGDIINCDETATRPALNFLYQLVSQGVERAASPIGNDMLRFTTMLGGTALGDMLPPFHIIKCTLINTNGDYSSATVLKKLFKEKYKEQDGWSYCFWKQKLTFTMKTVVKTYDYIRPYLWHEKSGTVITIQNKAWMDSVGLCMWADLVVKPWAKGRPKLIIWDNCPSHSVPEVHRFFADNKFDIGFLPKNMTDKLQVMDLVVNGPLKAKMRKIRNDHLYSQLQIHRKENALRQQSGLSKLPFKPNMPTITDGIDMVMDAVYNLFRSSSFMDSLKNSFVKVGLAKDTSTGEYIEYRSHYAPVAKEDKKKQILFADLALDDTIERARGMQLENFDNKEDGLPIDPEFGQLRDHDDEDDEDDDDDDSDDGNRSVVLNVDDVVLNVDDGDDRGVYV